MFIHSLQGCCRQPGKHLFALIYSHPSRCSSRHVAVNGNLVLQILPLFLLSFPSSSLLCLYRFRSFVTITSLIPRLWDNAPRRWILRLAPTIEMLPVHQIFPPVQPILPFTYAMRCNSSRARSVLLRQVATHRRNSQPRLKTLTPTRGWSHFHPPLFPFPLSLFSTLFFLSI